LRLCLIHSEFAKQGIEKSGRFVGMQSALIDKARVIISRVFFLIKIQQP